MFAEKRSNFIIYLLIFIFILFIAVIVYLYNSPLFERNEPIIKIDTAVYWNLKQPISVKITDDIGVKNYKAIFDDGKNKVVLLSQTLEKAEKEIQIQLEAPKVGMFFDQNSMKIIIEAVDSSLWNFFSGNSAISESKVLIDKEPPVLSILSNSYSISRGGSASVIFKAYDQSIDELYIETPFNKKFYPQKFYKDDYYISLLAWPVNEDNFSATIVAKDKAGNLTKSTVKYYLMDKKYKVSRIDLKDDFLNGKISTLVDGLNLNQKITIGIDKFRYINEKERVQNEELIHRITSKVFFEEKISEFNIKPFYPLHNGAAVATFGDHRLFFYDNELVSESYHVGLDLASIEMAEIVSTNLSRVAYTNANGIYGNMPILYHGLGLYTLYGHCSEVSVGLNEVIQPGTVIAKTGLTGLALGDHLHFGVLVQGIEVRPAEWMDTNWIKLNVTNVIEGAKKIIDKR